MFLRVFILLFPALFWLDADSQKGLLNNTDSTSVSGKIEGYSLNQEQQFIHYYVYDITGNSQKISSPLQKDGKFSFRFLQQYEGEFSLQYGSNFIKLYSKPGEEVNIKIDHDVADKVYQFPGAYKIEGWSAIISTHINKYFAQYLPMQHEREATISRQLSTTDFVELVHRNLQHDLGILDTYKNKNRSPEQFNDWMTNWLVYEAAGLIVQKPFLGIKADSISDVQLVALLKGIRIQNEKALHNSSYYKFLANWVDAIHMTPAESQDRTDMATAAVKSLEKIDRYVNGITREIAYFDSYAWDASSELATFRLEQVWDRFDSVIGDNVVQYSIETKRNELLQQFTPFSIRERIRELTADTITSSNLLSMLEKEKGHFVHVDFWGTWCAPCMADMRHRRSFVEQFKDMPIRFLFLAVKTKDRDSKAVQQKYSIPGVFYVLNESETNLANKVFGFSRYPSCFIINPDGNLVTKNIRVLNEKDAADLIWMLMKKEKTTR